MDESSALKSVFSSKIKANFNFRNIMDNKKEKYLSVNTTKLIKSNTRYKDFFHERKKLLSSKTQEQKNFFQRNSQLIVNSQRKTIKSALYKFPKDSNINIFKPINKINKSSKHKNINTTYKLLFHKNDYRNKRCYSAYYVNSNLSIKSNYISDLLIQKEESNKNKTQKLSDIDKKINEIEKFLNIKKYKINNSLDVSSLRKKENKKEKYLPDCLKKEFKIKGTNILSPFCMKSRDRFVLEKFKKFLSKSNALKTDKKYLIDNKLNIIYADNLKMYYEKLKKINSKLLLQGKKERYKYYYSPSEKQLRDMEKKVTFMRDIVECAYPNTAMIKIKDNREYFKKNKTNYKKFEAMCNKVNNEDYKNDFYEIKFK